MNKLPRPRLKRHLRVAGWAAVGTVGTLAAVGLIVVVTKEVPPRELLHWVSGGVETWAVWATILHIIID